MKLTRIVFLMGTSTELYQSTNDLLYQPIVSFIL